MPIRLAYGLSSVPPDERVAFSAFFIDMPCIAWTTRRLAHRPRQFPVAPEQIGTTPASCATGKVPWGNAMRHFRRLPFPA